MHWNCQLFMRSWALTIDEQLRLKHISNYVGNTYNKSNDMKRIVSHLTSA